MIQRHFFPPVKHGKIFVLQKIDKISSEKILVKRNTERNE